MLEPVTNAQLYLAIGIPVLINMMFNGLLIGIMWNSLSGDIRELRSDLKILTSKVVDIDNRLIRVEEKLGITPR